MARVIRGHRLRTAAVLALGVTAVAVGVATGDPSPSGAPTSPATAGAGDPTSAAAAPAATEPAPAEAVTAAELVPLAAAAGPRTSVDPAGSAAAQDDVVRLAVGQDFAAAVAGRAPGTTYLIEPGVHRLQTLELQGGDRVIGLPGAVMSGAEVLDPGAFREDDGTWVLGGRTEAPFLTPDGQLHGEVDPGRERDAANHDLWLDDVRAVHEPRRADVDAPGEWFFDYDAGEVVVFDDPADLDGIELAVTQYAIGSEGDGLVIEDLTITRYATPAQGGAIHAYGSDWSMRGLAVEDNHGAGIWLGEGASLTGSTITGNGQIGVTTGGGGSIWIEGNEIAGNGSLGYAWDWEAGGMKLKETQGAQVVGNWVHDNDGPGVWYDIDNRSGLVQGNLIEDNAVTGILLEISDGFDVTGNVIRGNGADGEYGLLGAGITVSNTGGVRIVDNDLGGNAHEVIAINYDRGGQLTQDLEVTGNRIRIERPESVGVYDDTAGQPLLRDGGITFEGNAYTLVGCEPCFLWDGPRTAEGWRGVGNDTGATGLDQAGP